MPVSLSSICLRMDSKDGVLVMSVVLSSSSEVSLLLMVVVGVEGVVWVCVGGVGEVVDAGGVVVVVAVVVDTCERFVV